MLDMKSQIDTVLKGIYEKINELEYYIDNPTAVELDDLAIDIKKFCDLLNLLSKEENAFYDEDIKKIQKEFLTWREKLIAFREVIKEELEFGNKKKAIIGYNKATALPKIEME